jgi:uncharacterized protein YqjF (DUF2071 family)
LRTYVRVGQQTGIYFLAEWLSNCLAVPLGRPFFGLPYHFGRLEFKHRAVEGDIAGRVTTKHGQFRYCSLSGVSSGLAISARDSLDEFLLERYTAFTHCRGYSRFFRVWHEPWPQAPIAVCVEEDNLLASTGAWVRAARVIGATYSPGVTDVWMGHPQKMPCE